MSTLAIMLVVITVMSVIANVWIILTASLDDDALDSLLKVSANGLFAGAGLLIFNIDNFVAFMSLDLWTAVTVVFTVLAMLSIGVTFFLLGRTK